MNIAHESYNLSNLEKRGQKKHKGICLEMRYLAAQVHPPLLDNEMVTLFANTLKVLYYEHVV
jgi:hypothetical protein